MGQVVPPQPPAVQSQAEPQYPLGGFIFSGSKEALSKLKAAGEKAGLRFKPYALPGEPSSIAISGSDAFGKLEALMALWNKASDGAFGQFTSGLLSEPPPSR